MKKIFKFRYKPVVITGFTVLLTSCNHYYYVPNIQNVPIFREKDEIRLSGAFGGGERSSCTEVQAAYSVSDNIGIMANYMSAKGGEISVDHDWARGSYFEGAVGYFRPLNSYSVFEVYGGLGVSNQEHIYYNNGTSDLRFTKLFLQPSYGITSKWIDVALSARISNISYNKVFNNINFSGEQYEYDMVNKIAKQKNYMFLEPAITLRGGWKYLKMQLQFATSSYHNRDLPFEDYHISLGFYFAFANPGRKQFPKNE